MTEGTDMNQIEKVARVAQAIKAEDSWRNWKGEEAFTRMAQAAIAAMPVQAEPVAELRAEITRLTEALRAAEERERDAVMSAYCTGATDVHNSWVEGTNGGEADFGEAASDYYSSIKGN